MGIVDTRSILTDTGEKPLISVVIPTYNAARYIVLAIDSVLQQTYSSLEIIVVDDGSTDDTEERLAVYGNRIRYIRQVNGGPSKARNHGLREARGKLIAFLDADDVWLPEKIQKQWEKMEADPTVHFVHTDIFNLIETTGESIYVDRNRRRFAGNCYKEVFRGNAIIPSTVLVSRQCLDQIGGFDEEIRGASTEDMDWCLRVARHFKFTFIDEPLIYYRVHPNNASLNKRKMLEDEYFVLDKALRSDPSLAVEYGLREARARIRQVAFGAGLANIDLNELLRARRYLKAALRYDPFSLKIGAYFLSTFLPSGVRTELRAIKQRLGT